MNDELFGGGVARNGRSFAVERTDTQTQTHARYREIRVGKTYWLNKSQTIRLGQYVFTGFATQIARTRNVFEHIDKSSNLH